MKSEKEVDKEHACWEIRRRPIGWQPKGSDEGLSAKNIENNKMLEFYLMLILLVSKEYHLSLEDAYDKVLESAYWIAARYNDKRWAKIDKLCKGK
jgi:hypothetical protein